jgi:hypothetical protein
MAALQGGGEGAVAKAEAPQCADVGSGGTAAGSCRCGKRDDVLLLADHLK